MRLALFSLLFSLRKAVDFSTNAIAQIQKWLENDFVYSKILDNVIVYIM